MEQYDPKTIEEKWQRVWKDEGAFEVSNEPVQPKSYVLEMLPYPSGSLHMGHMLVYTIGDVVTRFRTRNGCTCCIRRASIASACRPRTPPSARAAIRARRPSATSRNQALDGTHGLGDRLARDPRDPRAGVRPLAAVAVLAVLRERARVPKGRSRQVVPERPDRARQRAGPANGTCERCGAEVESRLMEQWFFRITDYAQALLDDLEIVDWPESIKSRQRNWIGRSEGAEIVFRIAEWDEDIAVFTTRPTRSTARPSSCSRRSTSSS